MNRQFFFCFFSAACLLSAGGPLLADSASNSIPVRLPEQSVNDPSIRELPGLRPDENLLFNGWGISTTGDQVSVSDMPLKMIVSPDGKYLLAVSGGYNNTGLSVIQIKDRQLTQFVPLKQCWNGLAFTADRKRLLVSGGGSGLVHVFAWKDGKVTPETPLSPAGRGHFLAGIAVNPATRKIYVCSEGDHEILVLNPATLALERRIGVGQYPHSAVFGKDNIRLYVSNWGGRSVSIVDTERGVLLQQATIGLRPNDMALAPDGRLFIACSGDNTVHVMDTKIIEKTGPEATPKRRPREAAREIISTSLYPESPEGSTPDAVAVSADGKTLFIANADNNNVAVVNITDPKVSTMEGFIPVGWYPTALAVSPDNGTLFVANGKGLRSRSNFPAQVNRPKRVQRSAPYDHVGQTLQGSISFIKRPTVQQMQEMTEQARRNSPFTPTALRAAPLKSKSIIPDTVGQPCPIKYVLYIIKENRTYDQVLGDFKDSTGKPAGNGDPNLTIYGEKVTPNQHQIARDYVLLDNLFCSGEVSLDGHSWCQAAIATDYRQRNWLSSYSRHGSIPGNEEMDTPAAGYFWDLCRRNGVSFRNYGEGAKKVPSANRGTWGGGRDMDRVKGWIEDLHKAEKTGNLPRFMIMSLGENHTRGTTPGAYTPDACVGSNDLGLGRIVEAATHSRFWTEMAIFVIEDDAQNGPDHVDAHRTTGFVISPYCKRGVVDSTLYTTASMVRTMELILGLPPMTQYDAAATPMFNCFRKTCLVTPYTPRMPQVDLFAKNTPKSPFAKESARMNFKEYDLAPEDELNRILWYAAKGPDAPFPTPIHRLHFSPMDR